MATQPEIAAKRAALARKVSARERAAGNMPGASIRYRGNKARLFQGGAVTPVKQPGLVKVTIDGANEPTYTRGSDIYGIPRTYKGRH